MHKRFTATVAGVNAKPHKDLGSIQVVTLNVETTRETIELQMLVGSTVEVEIDRFEWSNERPRKPEQASMIAALQEPCGVCGHALDQHKLDPNVCLGDAGGCVCDKFLPREGAGKGDRSTAEAYPVEKALNIPPDALCAVCGHEYVDHADNACGARIDKEEDADYDLMKPVPCPCAGFQLLDVDGEDGLVDEGAPGFDTDLPTEAEIDEAETEAARCEACGHPEEMHSPVFGCQVLFNDRGETQQCGCKEFDIPGFPPAEDPAWDAMPSASERTAEGTPRRRHSKTTVEGAIKAQSVA